MEITQMIKTSQTLALIFKIYYKYIKTNLNVNVPAQNYNFLLEH